MAKTATARAKPSSKPRVIPLDDEPLTPDDLKAIEEGRAAFARGDYVTLEQLEADVARQRRRTRSKKSLSRS